jgi:2-methylcitrate dehydratase PrpD
MSDYGAARLGLGHTRRLAAHLARIRFDALPAGVVHEARRGLLDWIGCAVAASRERPVAILLETFRDIGHARTATVIGQGGLKLGLLEAPVANGQMGHLLDFDDTHMGGVILHTSSPVLPALFALAERQKVSGRELICAYVAGFEAGVRTGQAAPAHHDGGWHLTGTLGSIAAGAAAARLLGLDADGVTRTLAIAATQAAGMQQNRGTMGKALHAGKAASNGLLAALLAARGFDGSDEILEGKRGFARIYSATSDPERLVEGLGERWEIERNGYKPYACGVVLHPLIDAMIALRQQVRLAPEQVAGVELVVHPAAVRITGVDDPQSGLMSKFSINHAASVAYLDGAAGLVQFTEARATAPDALAFRGKLRIGIDTGFRRDQAAAVLTASDGERFETTVEHATGTAGNPMSDAGLQAKFRGNVEPVLGAARAGSIMQLVWDVDSSADLRPLLDLLG